MTSQSENTKRIAKNTLVLYVRMLFSMLVSLYTSRVVLNTLGVEDYGIYNVVGGVVALMGFVTSLLSQGTTRFITIAVGVGDMEKLKDTCSALLTIHVFYGILVFLIGELVGPWVIETFLIIPKERLFSAHVVFQFALLSSIIGVVQTPYFSSIIAREKMNVFAYISIWDVLTRLIIVYFLLLVDCNKLILYAFLLFCVSSISALMYRVYCTRHFEECHFHFRLDKVLYKEIIQYTQWNTIGAVAFTMNGQGVTILLNMFFGPIVNAARGIAGSVAGIVNQFVANFQQAFTPQIVKYYATEDLSSMNHLILNAAKYSSYLVILIALPIFWETSYALKLWLVNVPDYTVVFARLTLIQIFIQTIDLPIGCGIHAVGKMKLPNVTAAIAYLSILPLSYIAMKLGATPEISYIITIFIYPIALGIDLWILNKYVQFPIFRFIKDAMIFPCSFILVCSIMPFYLLQNMNEGIVRLVLVAISSSIVALFLIYFVALNKEERNKVYAFVQNRIKIYK